MWSVITCKDCGMKRHLYGAEDWREEDYYCNQCNSKNYEFLNKDNWSAKDYATILGNELEDGNYHGMVGVPENLLKILKNNNISDTKCKVIMKEFGEMLWREL